MVPGWSAGVKRDLQLIGQKRLTLESSAFVVLLPWKRVVRSD